VVQARKKLVRTHVSKIARGIRRRTVVQATRQKCETLSEKYVKQKGLGCGSSSRVPVQQVHVLVLNRNTSKYIL
jgi:hypothetical protein